MMDSATESPSKEQIAMLREKDAAIYNHLNNELWK